MTLWPRLQIKSQHEPSTYTGLIDMSLAQGRVQGLGVRDYGLVFAQELVLTCPWLRFSDDARASRSVEYLVCVCVSVCVCVCVRLSLSLNLFVRACVCVHSLTHTYTHAYVCTCTHARCVASRAVEYSRPAVRESIYTIYP